FTPNDDTNEFCMNKENVRSVNDDNPQNCNVDEIQTAQEGNSANKGSKVDVYESVCSGHFKKSEAPHIGGSILCLLEELVKVGQTMGYNMDECVNNMTEIIESQGTDSVGNSGGIMCAWDPNSFRRINTTILDYFIMIRGMWLKTGVNLFIVVVYAPHDLGDKRMLWDYLTYVINQWDGEVVTMGDFNEVRYKSDRFGSVFNVQGAGMFNSFIANAGLKERQTLDGSFILNEVLQWCKLKKKQSLIFKVDFEKAYDSVRWDFLDDVLKKFGFGNKWCAWIQSCLRSSRGSTIINGNPTEEF
nr:RNA-directed DNA polymerase, eukaryota [Tanacetum cinerariifolium]